MSEEGRAHLPGPDLTRTPAETSGGPDPVEILRRRVVAAVRRTCPPYLADYADDFVQTVMMRLVAARRPGEGNSDVSSTYLAKAAYGVAVDELRRLYRRREDPVDGPVGLDGVAGSAPSPERNAAAAEIGRAVRVCLSRIVRPRRLAVILHLEGCSVPETAGLLKWTTKKTENLVYRGLADLRECLRSRGLEP